jgi:hypothetical protein
MRPAVFVGTTLLVFSGWAVLAQGGGSPYESVVKDMISALDVLSETLGTIKDEPSAKTARPEVKKAADRLDEVRKKAQGLQQPDKAEKDRITREYKVKLETSLKKVLAEVARVKGVPGGEEAVKEIYGSESRKK